jgi:hypothetical protein
MRAAHDSPTMACGHPQGMKQFRELGASFMIIADKATVYELFQPEKRKVWPSPPPLPQPASDESTTSSAAEPTHEAP